MKHIRDISLGLAAICSLGSGAYSAHLAAARSAASLLPGDIMANPGKYNGKHVNVRGYVVVGPESRNIFDSQEGEHSPKGACLGLDGPNAMFSSFHKRYIRRLSGTFRRNLCGEHDVCLYWCGKSGIELDKDSKP